MAGLSWRPRIPRKEGATFHGSHDCDPLARMVADIHMRLDHIEAKIHTVDRIEPRLVAMERQQSMAFERVEARLAHLSALERNNTQQQHQSQADLSWHMCELRQTMRQQQMQESAEVQYIGPFYVYPEDGQQNFGQQGVGQRHEGLNLNILDGHHCQTEISAVVAYKAGLPLQQLEKT